MKLILLKQDQAGQWMYQVADTDWQIPCVDWQYGPLGREQCIDQARDRFGSNLQVGPIPSDRLAILKSIESKHGKEMLQSLAHGEIEVWNFILCNRQNAVMDKTNEVSRMECSLCYESESVGKFFRRHGFNF